MKKINPVKKWTCLAGAGLLAGVLALTGCQSASGTQTNMAMATQTSVLPMAIRQALKEDGYEEFSERTDYDNGINPADVLSESEFKKGSSEYIIYEFSCANAALNAFDSLEKHERGNLDQSVSRTGDYLQAGSDSYVCTDNLIVASSDASALDQFSSWNLL